MSFGEHLNQIVENKMSNDYDFTAKIYDPALYLFLKSIRVAVLNELLQYKEKAIIDICCGTGNQLKLLSENGFTDLSGLDISNSMLDVARKGGSQLKIYNRDATEMEFDDEVFDVAIISFALHEKERIIQEKMISETHRVVKNGGMILIVDYAFDKDTSLAGRLGIGLIERMAGSEHYTNFKQYIQNNGLVSLMETEKFTSLKKSRKAFGGVTISVFQKKPGTP